jgi:hypothetical protein
MAFYAYHIYPYLVDKLGDPEPMREIRQRLIPLAQGEVLEIGVGPGVNFLHYDPARVNKVSTVALASPGAQVIATRWSGSARDQ